MTENQIDRISLKSALDCGIWKMVWAGEPNRPIAVEMTYNDLVKICDMIKKENT